MTTMTPFTTAEQISAFLIGQGYEAAATGGGYSAWFLIQQTRRRCWQIAITNAQDTAELQPGQAVIVTLEGPDGAPVEVVDLDTPDALPKTLARLVDLGRESYGRPLQIAVSKAGKLTLQSPQQRWTGDEPAIMLSSLFAGQQMMAITDDAGAFRLTYLGFEAGGFTSVAMATEAAPDFVRAVLARMSAMIVD
ncbi:hypothetical protein ACU4GI_33420 [Cupriavidus basilensis]